MTEVINNMKNAAPPEQPVKQALWDWQRATQINAYAPHTDALPDWYTHPDFSDKWLYNYLTWYQVLEASGNAATNTRVQIRNLRFYVLSQSTRTWSQVPLDLTASPSVDIWTQENNWFQPVEGGQNPRDYDDSHAGGRAVTVKHPKFIHGYGTPKSLPNPADVRAVWVAMDFRLVVNNPGLPDDRASAQYIVNAGIDWYPGGGRDWNRADAPAAGQSRLMRAGNEWRTTALLVPNILPGYMPGSGGRPTDAAWNELAANPPADPGLTGNPPPPPPPPPPSASGTTIVAKHSGKCVDVPAHNQADGVVVNQYACNSPVTNNQLFTFKDMGRSQFEIIAAHSGKCLEVQNGYLADGIPVQQNTCTGSARQLWTQRIAADGNTELVSVVSNKCLDVKDHSTANSVPMQVWACTGEPHQSFKLTGQPVSHEIIAKHSGKCLDVAANSTSPGAAIHQYTCEGNANQKWTLNDRGNGQYDIRAKHSGLCLDTNNATADGSALQQYTCSGGARQLWTLRTMAGGYYELVSAATGKCVDVKANSPDNSAVVQQYNCAETSDNQLWWIK